MMKMKFIHFQSSFLKAFNFLVSNDCGHVSCLTSLPFPHDHCLLGFDQNIHISHVNMLASLVDRIQITMASPVTLWWMNGI